MLKMGNLVPEIPWGIVAVNACLFFIIFKEGGESTCKHFMSPVMSLIPKPLSQAFALEHLENNSLVCKRLQHREARSDLISLGCKEAVCIVLLKIHPRVV